MGDLIILSLAFSILLLFSIFLVSLIIKEVKNYNISYDSYYLMPVGIYSFCLLVCILLLYIINNEGFKIVFNFTNG